MDNGRVKRNEGGVECFIVTLRFLYPREAGVVPSVWIWESHDLFHAQPLLGALPLKYLFYGGLIWDSLH